MTAQRELGAKGDGTVAPRISSWHAAVVFQVFTLMIYVVLPIWYSVVLVSPGSVSEYLPHQTPVNGTTIAEVVPFSVIWALLVYFTLKSSKVALLGSIAYGIFWLIILPVAFVTGGLLAPDFSDFAYFPIIILLVIFSAMAYRAFPNKAR